MKKRSALIYGIISFIVAAVLSVAYVFLMQLLISNETKSNVCNYTKEVSKYIDGYIDTTYKEIDTILTSSSSSKDENIQYIVNKYGSIGISGAGYMNDGESYVLVDGTGTKNGNIDSSYIKKNRTIEQKASIINYRYVFGNEDKSVVLYSFDYEDSKYFVIQDFSIVNDVIDNTYGKGLSYYYVAYKDGIITNSNDKNPQDVITLNNIFGSDADLIDKTSEDNYIVIRLGAKQYYATSNKILSNYNNLDLYLVVTTSATYLTNISTTLLVGSIIFAAALATFFIIFIVLCAIKTTRTKRKILKKPNQIEDENHYLIVIDRKGKIVSKNKKYIDLGLKPLQYIPALFNVLELTSEDDNFINLLEVNNGFTAKVIDANGIEHFIKFLAVKSNYGYQLLGDDIDSQQAMTSVALASKKEENLYKDSSERDEKYDSEVFVDDYYTNTYTKKALIIELNKIIQNKAANYKKTYMFYIGNINLDEILRTYGESIEELINVYTIKLTRKIVGEKVKIYNVDDHHFALFIELENSFMALQKLMDQFEEEIKKPAKIFSNELQLEISIGIYSFGTTGVNGVNAKTIIDKTILAFKHTADLVKKFYYLYDNSLDLVFAADKIIEEDIRKGLANNEFVTYYQPNFSLKDNKVSGFECLLRWNNDKYRYDSPYKYIKVAEKVGLINEIGYFTLVESFKLMKKLNDPSLHISVNVSPAQFLQPGFTSRLVHLYAEYGVPYQCICVEITETFLIQSMSEVVEKLKYLRSYGIKVYLDDFGTGYSSLLYLSELPVDVIKIDKAFITPLKTSKSARTIVSELISIANQLEISLVAEGVEDDYQVNFLEKKGCNNIQGYYFSKPVPVEKLDAVLKITRESRKGK